MNVLNPPATFQLRGDAQQLFGELNKVRREMGGVGDAMGKLKGIAAAALAGFSVAGITNFIRNQAEAADALGKTADKLNLSTEALTAFDLAAQDAGVSLEAAHKLLLDSQKRLGEAAAGSGEAAKFMKVLGLNVKELINLAPDEVFARYSEAIAQLQTPAERLAAAQSLFGKQAQEAFTLIEAGRPALIAARESTEKYGLALSRIDTAKIEIAGDKVGLLGTISEAAGKKIAAGLAPFISAVAEELLGAAEGTSNLQTRVEQFGAIAYTAFQVVANAARTMQAAFFGVAAGGARLLQALTWGDVSKAFEASVDANLAKANEALGKIKSIAEIQQGIVDVMEKARKDAAASVKPEPPPKGGGKTLVQAPPPPTLQQQLAALVPAQDNKDNSNWLQQAADRQQAEREAFAADYRERAAMITAYENAAVAEAARGAQERRQIAESELQFRAAGLDAVFSLLSIHAGKSKAISMAAFLWQKKEAIAAAVINTKNAVTATYARLGYPWGIPAAAAMAALGAAQIAAMVSTNPGSGIGSAGSGGGSASLATPSNEVFSNRNNGTDQERGLAPQVVYQIIYKGNVYGLDDFEETVIETFRNHVDRDGVPISPTSRQAMEIRDA